MHTTIIAEAGVNHNGDEQKAIEMVEVAAQAGADTIKFQTFVPQAMVTQQVSKAKYQLADNSDRQSQFDMLRALQLSKQSYQALLAQCDAKDIRFLSTPFDCISLNFLVDELGLRELKISSGDLTNGPLLLAAAQKNCDIILSTGMSTLSEVERALGVLAFGLLQSTEKPCFQAFERAYTSPQGQAALDQKVSLLHCTSEYPAYVNHINLTAIETLEYAFQLPTGLSDHSIGTHIPVAAVALGARIIEKHFTLDCSLPGPDHKASLEPDALQLMIQQIRDVERALGDGKKLPRGQEWDHRPLGRQSLVALQSIKQGEAFTAATLGVKRAGNGISAMHYWDWLGKLSSRDYSEDEVVVSDN